MTFAETGLPNGSSWSVLFDGTRHAAATPSIPVLVPNGTYPFTVASDGYLPSPASGSITVDGTNRSLSVSFTPVTYPVTFVEAGLTTGTEWSVTAGGVAYASTAAAIGFSEPNGTYGYRLGIVEGWTTPSFTGTINVSGAAVSDTVAWSRVNYTITFVASGLPPGTNWWVDFDGVTESAGFDFVFGGIANGTYGFTTGTAADFAPSPGSGTVFVDGANETRVVDFGPVYRVEFAAGGLPGGRVWSVTLAGTTRSSTAASINFTEPNGTFGFAVGSVGGYTAAPQNGTVQVNGDPILESVEFEPRASSQTVLGLPPIVGNAALGGILAVVALAEGAAILRRRRSRLAPPS